jgi:HSP20 family protein
MNTQTELARHAETTPRHWLRPTADLQEGKEGFRLILDVPGVGSDKLTVQVHRGTLHIEGIRDDRVGYRRSFELTDVVDLKNVQAELKNGVLTLTLPRSQESQPRRIAVN